MTYVRATLVGCLLLPLLLLVPKTAATSPWVLREDELIVSMRFDYQQAEKEYLDAGELESYSLDGTYRSTTLVTSARFGLVDRLELELNLPLRLVSYRADPVILLPCEEGSLDCYQENVINVSQTTAGLADIELSTRYQFLQGRVAGAFELRLKTPTGYDPPAGTFGEEPKSRRDFRQNIQTYVQPDNVQDDVTLGDGQADLAGLLLLGWSLPTRTYLRFDGGYNLRMAGAGDQVIGHLQVGQAIGRRILLTGGSRLAYSVEEGRVIGISVAADDPSLPAVDYGGTTNLRLREVPLAEDRLDAHIGALFRVTRQVEANLSYSRVLWGRNTARTQTLSLGFGVKFDISSGEDT